MLKTAGFIIGGIFVGAVAVEVFRKKCPEALDSLYTKTRQTLTNAKDAFSDGYHDALKPKQVASAAA